MKTIISRKSQVAFAAVILSVLFSGLFMSRSPLADETKGQPRMKMKSPETGDMEMKGMDMGGMKMQPGSVMLTPAKQKLIGVKTHTVKTRRLVKTIRTAGRIDYDESRLAEINLRVSGWIERLYADRTGKYIKKGEPLFTIYSPQLVSAQQEFLISKKSGFSGATKDPAKTKLLLLNVSESQIDELQKNGAPSTYMEVHSPVSGYVIFKSALAGGYVKPGETVFRIADISRVWVLADIYESDIPFVKIGQRARITVTPLPGKNLTGKITYIYPYLSPQTRSVKVRIELENPDEKLKPEMYADVQIEVNLGKRLAVPQSAVLDSGLRKLVFVRTGAGMYAPRQIELNNPVGDYHPVISGLNEGEIVVSSATFFLDSESKLMASMEGMMGLLGMGDWKMESAKMGEMDMGDMKAKGMEMGGMIEGAKKKPDGEKKQ